MYSYCTYCTRVFNGTGAAAAATSGDAERLGGTAGAAEDGALVPHANARQTHHVLSAASAAARTAPEPRSTREREHEHEPGPTPRYTC